MQDLQGKTALVTGGSRGIGLKTAQALADNGVNVAIVGRDNESLKDALLTLEKKDVKAIAISGDVSVKEDIQSIVAEVLDDFGKIDILINNAGIMGNGSFFDDNEDMFRRMIDVNVFGMYYMMKEVLSHMK